MKPHPAGIISENKQHAFDKIRFARAIRPDNAGEVLMERTNHLPISIGLEIVKHNPIDN